MAQELLTAMMFYRDIALQSKIWPVRFSFSDGKLHCAECGAWGHEKQQIKHSIHCPFRKAEAIYQELRAVLSRESWNGKGWIDRAYHGRFCPWCGAKVACQEHKAEPESCPCCGFRPEKGD